MNNCNKRYVDLSGVYSYYYYTNTEESLSAVVKYVDDISIGKTFSLFKKLAKITNINIQPGIPLNIISFCINNYLNTIMKDMFLKVKINKVEYDCLIKTYKNIYELKYYGLDFKNCLDDFLHNNKNFFEFKKNMLLKYIIG